MTRPPLTTLAKQGNAKAIAALLNHQLQPKGITVKIAYQDRTLQVLLESAEVSDQKQLVNFIAKVIKKLEIESIKTVKMYGRRTGDKQPVWSESWDFASPENHLHSLNPLTPFKSKSKKLVYAIYLFYITAIFVILSWFRIPFTVPVAVVSGSVDLYLLLTSEDYKKQKVDSKKRAEEAERRRKWEAEALKKAKKVKQQQKQHDFEALLQAKSTSIPQLKTDLAKKVLKEFEKVQIHLNQSVNATQLPEILFSAKSAVQEFDLSDDYEVCLDLSHLVDKILFFYELYAECYKLKLDSLNNPTVVSAISRKSDLGRLISHDFPHLATLGLSELTEQKFSNLLVSDLSTRYYDFDATAKAAKEKASDYLKLLQKVIYTSH
ncbi:MAG: hypothetical protein ACOC0N_10120 [Chroococcales cyanobacterium]